MGKPGRPPKDPAKAVLKAIWSLSPEDQAKVLFMLEAQKDFRKQAELDAKLKAGLAAAKEG